MANANKSAGADIARGVPTPAKNQTRTGASAQSPVGVRGATRPREAQRVAATRQGASAVKAHQANGRRVKK